MSNITVIVLGHFVIGLLFGLKAILDKEQMESVIQEFLSTSNKDDRNKETTVKLARNKPFMLIYCSFIGYFHFYFLAKKLFKKKQQKTIGGKNK